MSIIVKLLYESKIIITVNKYIFQLKYKALLRRKEELINEPMDLAVVYWWLDWVSVLQLIIWSSTNDFVTEQLSLAFL